MSDWKPIETAPKDGTDVLVFYDGIITVAHCRRMYWHLDFFLGCDPDPPSSPTHWMPLPEPPK